MTSKDSSCARSRSSHDSKGYALTPTATAAAQPLSPRNVWRAGGGDTCLSLQVLYDRHMLFLDFKSLGARQPLYMNLLRDPLKMQVSDFYFWRDCMCSSRKEFCQVAWQSSDNMPTCSLTMDAGDALPPARRSTAARLPLGRRLTVPTISL